MDNNEAEASSGSDQSSSPLSVEEYQIDPELVRRWFEIPHSDAVNFEGKRIAFDLLYSAIDGIISTQIRMMSVMADSPMGGSSDFAKEIFDIGNGIIRSLNQLRQFQTIVMYEATGTELDRSGRVVGEGQPDGE